MTSKRSDQSYGLPPPITKLTVEQDLRLRVLHDKLKDNYHEMEEEITTLIIALQHQNFVLGNSITNLVNKWPTLHEDIIFIGTSKGIPKEIQP